MKRILTWPSPKTLFGIFIFASFMFIITSIAYNPIKDYVIELWRGKPEVVVNILKITYAPIGEKPLGIKEFIMSYYYGRDISTLIVMDTNAQKTLKTKALLSHTLNFNFMACPECTYYYITATKLNSVKADKVTIDLKSTVIPDILYRSPKITKGDCGGISASKGCYIVMEDIVESEPNVFYLSTSKSSDISVSSCIVNNKYNCEIRYITGFAKSFRPTDKGIMFGNKYLHFPSFWNMPPDAMYLYDPERHYSLNNPWIKLSGDIETVKKLK